MFFSYLLVLFVLLFFPVIGYLAADTDAGKTLASFVGALLFFVSVFFALIIPTDLLVLTITMAALGLVTGGVAFGVYMLGFVLGYAVILAAYKSGINLPTSKMIFNYAFAITVGCLLGFFLPALSPALIMVIAYSTFFVSGLLSLLHSKSSPALHYFCHVIYAAAITASLLGLLAGLGIVANILLLPIGIGTFSGIFIMTSLESKFAPGITVAELAERVQQGINSSNENNDLDGDGNPRVVEWKEDDSKLISSSVSNEATKFGVGGDLQHREPTSVDHNEMDAVERDTDCLNVVSGEELGAIEQTHNHEPLNAAYQQASNGRSVVVTDHVSHAGVAEKPGCPYILEIIDGSVNILVDMLVSLLPFCRSARLCIP